MASEHVILATDGLSDLSRMHNYDASPHVQKTLPEAIIELQPTHSSRCSKAACLSDDLSKLTRRGLTAERGSA